VERQIRAKKLQTAEDDTAEIEAASFKKFTVETNALARVCVIYVHPFPIIFGHMKPLVESD
jgi:hypothetical protein